MSAPKISAAMSAGDTFFLAAVGRASAMIEGSCGLPQCGQLGALGEMSLPQSGHFIRGIVRVSVPIQYSGPRSTAYRSRNCVLGRAALTMVRSLLAQKLPNMDQDTKSAQLIRLHEAAQQLSAYLAAAGSVKKDSEAAARRHVFAACLHAIDAEESDLTAGDVTRYNDLT